MLLQSESDLARLTEVRATGNWIRLGAGVSLLALATMDLVGRALPLVAEMAASLGDPELVARVTLGGALAPGAPWGDPLAALAAHDALVVVESLRGPRLIPFDDLLAGMEGSAPEPDEVIVCVDVPVHEPAPSERAVRAWRRELLDGEGDAALSLAALGVVEGMGLVRCGLGVSCPGLRASAMVRTRELLLSTTLARVDREGLEKAVDADLHPAGRDLAMIAGDLVWSFARRARAEIT